MSPCLLRAHSQFLFALIPSSCSCFFPLSPLEEKKVREVSNSQTASFPWLFIIAVYMFLKLQKTVTIFNVSICFAELHTGGQVNILAVQSKLETIAFKTKMECSHAQNPFTNHQPKPSTTEDVVQHISSDKRSLSVGADSGSRTLRNVPHGRGKLKTVTGEMVYSGEWCKGKVRQ